MDTTACEWWGQDAGPPACMCRMVLLPQKPAAACLSARECVSTLTATLTAAVRLIACVPAPGPSPPPPHTHTPHTHPPLPCLQVQVVPRV
jgi:hypothetical protein